MTRMRFSSCPPRRQSTTSACFSLEQVLLTRGLEIIFHPSIGLELTLSLPLCSAVSRWAWCDCTFPLAGEGLSASWRVRSILILITSCKVKIEYSTDSGVTFAHFLVFRTTSPLPYFGFVAHFLLSHHSRMPHFRARI